MQEMPEIVYITVRTPDMIIHRRIFSQSISNHEAKKVKELGCEEFFEELMKHGWIDKITRSIKMFDYRHERGINYFEWGAALIKK